MRRHSVPTQSKPKYVHAYSNLNCSNTRNRNYGTVSCVKINIQYTYVVYLTPLKLKMWKAFATVQLACAWHVKSHEKSFCDFNSLISKKHSFSDQALTVVDVPRRGFHFRAYSAFKYETPTSGFQQNKSEWKTINTSVKVQSVCMRGDITRLRLSCGLCSLSFLMGSVH